MISAYLSFIASLSDGKFDKDVESISCSYLLKNSISPLRLCPCILIPDLEWIKTLRDFYHNNEFIEIETPVLGNAASWAAAAPFITHLFCCQNLIIESC